MPRKTTASRSKAKPAKTRKATETGETMEEIQASIARALLGIIAIAIFIGFVLSPGPSIFLP